MSRIAHIFFDTNMRNGHDGLQLILGRKKILAHETAIFVNKSWTAAKVLTNADILLHVKRPGGINPAAIKHLPNCIEGQDLNYAKALEAAVTERFTRDKGKRSR